MKQQTKALFVCALTVTVTLLTSCDQYPIFYAISNEHEEVPSLIQGSPSKIVERQDGDSLELFVANGKLWRYDQESAWVLYGKPPDTVRDGTVRDVAVAGKTLYALTIDGTTRAVWRVTAASSWEEIYSAGDIVAIFGGAKNLYIGRGTRSTAKVLIYNGTALNGDDSTIISGELRGAASAGDVDWVATAENGITTGSGITFAEQPLPGSTGHIITGILNTAESGIVAVTSDGYVYAGSSWTEREDVEFTGALAVWKNNSGAVLLLAGIHVSGTSYTYGYRELNLDGTWNTGSDNGKPGTGPVATSGKDEYNSNFSSRALTSLYALPSSDSASPLIFASTQKDGLYAYHNGKWNGWNGQ